MKTLLTLSLALLLLPAPATQPVRSALYPTDWKPATPDPEGRFLHDFSYAGYHKGEKPIPVAEGKTFSVVADPTGKQDATAAIQAAIDEAGRSGGGVVLLAAGTYRLTFPTGMTAAIALNQSNVVLRGAGPARTRLLLEETNSRQKAVIRVGPDAPPNWIGAGTGVSITRDLPLPTATIPIESTDTLKSGDLVALRMDATQPFIDELSMTGKWTTTMPSIRGISLLRRIVAIDAAARTATLDTPTRYGLLARDNLRLVKINGPLVQESGVEELSIAMRQNTREGWGEEDYTRPGTGVYELHSSSAVLFAGCENSWARRIATYLPEGNATYHLHSNGIKIMSSRQVTVADCDFRLPQYRGGGGNGYLFVHASNDNLIRDCIAVAGRHNYDLQSMSCTGSVILRCTSRNPTLSSDFHMHFSTANLLDSMTMDGDYLECVYRPYGGASVHGVTGSQNVFWNTVGLAYPPRGNRRYIVQSKQFGHGYIIGTAGPAPAISPDSTGHIEHVGAGANLEPKSLYEDQLKRRMVR